MNRYYDPPAPRGTTPHPPAQRPQVSSDTDVLIGGFFLLTLALVMFMLWSKAQLNEHDNATTGAPVTSSVVSPAAVVAGTGQPSAETAVTEVGRAIGTWYEHAADGEELVVQMSEGTFSVGDKLAVERPKGLHARNVTFTAETPYSWCFEAHDTTTEQTYRYLPDIGEAAPGSCP